MTLDTATAALTKIAAVDLNIVRIGRADYVPVGNLRYVVMLAREALGLPRVPGEAMSDDVAPNHDEMTLEEMFAAYSSRWSLRVWWNDYATYGAKIGPLSFIAYRWFDERWRVSWTWNWSRFGYEHIVIGGPLT